MKLDFKNFWLVVAVSLTLQFSTRVFAQGPARLDGAADSARGHANGFPHGPGRARADAISGAGSGVSIPDRKHRR